MAKAYALQITMNINFYFKTQSFLNTWLTRGPVWIV